MLHSRELRVITVELKHPDPRHILTSRSRWTRELPLSRVTSFTCAALLSLIRNSRSPLTSPTADRLAPGVAGRGLPSFRSTCSALGTFSSASTRALRASSGWSAANCHRKGTKQTNGPLDFDDRRGAPTRTSMQAVLPSSYATISWRAIPPVRLTCDIRRRVLSSEDNGWDSRRLFGGTDAMLCL